MHREILCGGHDHAASGFVHSAGGNTALRLGIADGSRSAPTRIGSAHYGSSGAPGLYRWARRSVHHRRLGPAACPGQKPGHPESVAVDLGGRRQPLQDIWLAAELAGALPQWPRAPSPQWHRWSAVARGAWRRQAVGG